MISLLIVNFDNFGASGIMYHFLFKVEINDIGGFFITTFIFEIKQVVLAQTQL